MTVDELQVLITANTNSLRKEIKNTQKEVSSLQKHVSSTSSAITKAFSMVKAGIVALGIGKLISMIGSQMDSAINRLDALNNFPRVMSNLGVSNEDAQASMKRLSNALVGLPTTLDDATQSVQRFTSANGNVKASTEMFLALNNAILAGGASSEIQRSALEQLSQSYAKGKPDMMEWRTAMMAMPAQLKQVAIAMGYASSDQLGEALRGGTVSMNEFMVKLTELNKQGANGFQSFEEQARNSTGGVATSMTNVKTAIVRGLAEIMNAIGQSNIASFFQGIARAINSVIPYITGFVKACVWAVSSVSSLFGGKSTKKNIEDTNKAISSLGSSVGGSTASGIDKATGSAKKLNKELKGLASFDEMNVLKDTSSSDSGSGSSGSGTSGGAVGGDLSGIDLSAFDTGLDNTSSKADEVAQHLQEIFGLVGQTMLSIWNSEPVQAFVDFVTVSGQFLLDTITTFASTIWINLQMTWDNIGLDVTTALANISLLWTTFWTDLSVGIQTWGQPIVKGVTGVFNSIYKDVIDPTLQIISKLWADFSGLLVEKWNTYGMPLIDNIGQFATTIISLFQKIWDSIIEPIITPFLEQLSWLWDTHIKGMVSNVMDFIGKLTTGALEIWNKFISPIVGFLVDTLSPIWSSVLSAISNAFSGTMGTAFALVSDIIGSISRVLGGLVDFVSGVFTANWSKAWNGVKDVFKGIVDGLVSIFKMPINLIIDGINTFIGGLNKLKIPDWVPGVGGKGFHIDKLPKLARGGVVDRPTTAIIGEAGREAVVPLENNTGWIDEIASKLNNIGGGSNPIQLVVKLGEDTLLDKVVDGINQKAFENNGEVFAI